MMSYIIQRMPCKGCYRISIVLALCGLDGRKTIRMRHVWTLFISKVGGKYLRSQNFRIGVNGALVTVCDFKWIKARMQIWIRFGATSDEVGSDEIELKHLDSFKRN